MSSSSLQYEEINKNLSIDANDESDNYYENNSICSCQFSSDLSCTTNQCLNYATLTECIKCSNLCQNNKFQRNYSIKLEVRSVEKKGYGLFCLEDIKSHQFIKEYVGELVSEKELLRRSEFLLSSDLI